MTHSIVGSGTLVAAALLGAALPGTAADPGLPDWMAGRWCGTRSEPQIEEVWLIPAGGLMLGLARTVSASGRPTQFEFLRIELRDGVPTYLAQPQGAPPVAFKLTQAGATSARFENPAHDFPQRIEYRRTGSSLRAEIAGPRGGGERVIGFDYAACPPDTRKE